MEESKELLAFCHHVRTLRLQQHLSQKEMAHIMGIGVKGLEQIEAGIIPPRLGAMTLVRLHVYFHVSIQDLFLPMES